MKGPPLGLLSSRLSVLLEHADEPIFLGHDWGNGFLEGSPGTSSDEAEVFAEAEGGDALFEGGAAAVEEALEKSFEAKRTGDAGFDFGELSGGEFFPAWADGGAVAEAAKEEFDFGKGETHFSGEADEQDAVESVGGIAALAAGAVRGS